MLRPPIDVVSAAMKARGKTYSRATRIAKKPAHAIAAPTTSSGRRRPYRDVDRSDW